VNNPPATQPKNSRLQRSALSYLAQLSFTVITLAIAIFATPRLIRWLGSEKLGTVRVAADWAGYLGLLELGLGGATTAVLAGAMHSGEPERLRNAMAACVRAYRRVALAMLVFGGLLILVIPRLVFHEGNFPPAMIEELRWATALNVASSAFIFFSPWRAIWDVDQRGYIVSFALIVQSVTLTGGSLLLAYKGFGIVGQSVATVLGTAIFYALIGFLTLRAYPSVIRSRAVPDVAEHARALRKLNWPTLALNLANRVSFLSDNLVVGYFFGPSLVVPFFITQRLMQLAGSQLATVGNVTWAGLVQIRQTHGAELFNRRLLEISRLITLLGVVVLVPIYAFDESFVGRWVGEAQFGGNGLAFFAALNALLVSIASFWGWVFTGTGLVDRVVPVSLAAAGVNVIVSILATFLLGHWSSRLGMLGPLVGTSAACITCYSWWMPVLLKRNFGTSIRGIIFAVGRPLLVGIPLAVVLVAIVRPHPPRGWISLCAAMAASGSSLLIISWYFALNSVERAMWQERFGSNIAARLKKKPKPDSSVA
jgi:O-antigen/teichoic acid export membrane protein